MIQMPSIGGNKLGTPLISEYVAYLLDDRGRSFRTVQGYRDSVEFFASTRPDAPGVRAVRQATKASCPNEVRMVTDDELDWSTVTLGDCEQFVRRPLTGAGTAPSDSTRRRRAFGLKAFFEFLVDHDIIDRDPTRKLRAPKVHVDKPKPIPDSVWLSIWDQPMGPDDRVLLGLGYYFGLRRHEMIGIAPHHFNLATRRVQDFPRKGGKTNTIVYGGNLELFRRHLPHLAVRLDEFEQDLTFLVTSRQGDLRLLALTEHIAVTNPSDNTINRRLTALAGKGAMHVTPHMMRHSFGTNLQRCRVPDTVIADQMAHSNLQTTRAYLDTTLWYEGLGDDDERGAA